MSLELANARTMILGFFRRSRNAALIDRLYASIVAASRQPALFTDLGVPDTFEGRFESVTLHAALVVRRLRDTPEPGPEMAQSLVDTIFRHFDRTLREMGVGDTGVPKRMKRLAEAFLGRSAAYDQALHQGGEELEVSLRRNICRGERSAADLARYVEACVAALSDEPLQAFVDAAIRFPDPAGFAAPAVPSAEIAH